MKDSPSERYNVAVIKCRRSIAINIAMFSGGINHLHGIKNVTVSQYVLKAIDSLDDIDCIADGY